MSALLAFDTTQNRFEALQLSAENRLKVEQKALTSATDTITAEQGGAWTVGVSNFPATQPVSIADTVAVSMAAPTKSSVAISNTTVADVSAMSECVVVYSGTTLLTNTNSAPVNIYGSFDNSTFFQLTEAVFPSQLDSDDKVRQGSCHVKLAGIKYLKISPAPSSPLGETASAFVFGV
jgi:hypothetical protein